VSALRDFTRVQLFMLEEMRNRSISFDQADREFMAEFNNIIQAFESKKREIKKELGSPTIDEVINGKYLLLFMVNSLGNHFKTRARDFSDSVGNNENSSPIETT
jgi:hypothetical protein